MYEWAKSWQQSKATVFRPFYDTSSTFYLSAPPELLTKSVSKERTYLTATKARRKLTEADAVPSAETMPERIGTPDLLHGLQTATAISYSLGWAGQFHEDPIRRLYTGGMKSAL
ncbi:hypothetical protein QAD02_019141 [Eretmocerus hayati]|uniref:Uncharacterized protein n=1 Tax=Eretmocerus hayati TaxID=131215 RepID=A0ACC2PIC1_9HYME|nr:hypothetical protein QAD02_019141 [Eretmocerus hayati]